jgi:hypothetical protein
MKFMPIAAALLLIVMMSTRVAHADGSAANVSPQTVTRVAKVAGSVIQATVRSVDRATPAGPAGVGDVAAVCITSGSDVGQCGVSATLAQAACSVAGKPLSACHGGDKVARTQHVALCNAEDVGLSGCLSKYAAALVRHPDAAEKAYQFSVRRDDKNLPDVTVLVTAKQTEQDAAQMALDSMTSATTASSN